MSCKHTEGWCWKFELGSLPVPEQDEFQPQHSLQPWTCKLMSRTLKKINPVKYFYGLFFTNIWFILLCLQVKWRGLEVQVNIKLKTADLHSWTMMKQQHGNITDRFGFFFLPHGRMRCLFRQNSAFMWSSRSRWLTICWDCQTPCRTYGNHHGQPETSGHEAKQQKTNRNKPARQRLSWKTLKIEYPIRRAAACSVYSAESIGEMKTAREHVKSSLVC